MMREIRSNSESMTVTETAWWALATVLTVWSLLAVGLAQVGLFRGWALLAAGLLACMVGWGVVRTMKPLLRLRSWRRESLFLAVILAAGFGLFGWPAEHFPMIGDSSIYPNTAAMLIRTGGLEYHYDPLDGLTLEQKQLFYVPSDRQIPGVEIQSYQGLLYGAYYIMDADQNTVVSSRPPVAIAWMGLFGMLFGERGMLYVTPLFGAMSLAALYFLGKRVFGPGTGALAAVLLLVSFPQLHFSRAPYAEVVGQFFVLVALYTWAAYLQRRQPMYILAGLGALTAAFATRIDAILVLPTLALFILLLFLRRDWNGLLFVGVGLVATVGLALWTVNRPYTGATAELLLIGQLRFLCQLGPGAILALMTLLGLTLALALLLKRRLPWARLWRFARRGLSAAVVLAIAYALYIRPLRPEYVTLNGTQFYTHNEELMTLAAQYLGHPTVWLGALGMVLVIRQHRIPPEQVMVLFFVTFFAVSFFWKYTTARVYPVALRRLVPEVLPGFLLLGAFALQRMRQRRAWRWAALGLAGLTMALLMRVSVPYWFYREAEGARDLLDALAKRLPSDAVILFEPGREGSIVGWFAAPLWSFHQRQALLFNEGKLDHSTVDEVLCLWQGQGKEIYAVSWRDPAEWWPGDFQGRLEEEVIWDSDIIGQSLHFPPLIWRFAFTFSIYRLEEVDCAPSSGGYPPPYAQPFDAPRQQCYNTHRLSRADKVP
jgi:hypothetical protein